MRELREMSVKIPVAATKNKNIIILLNGADDDNPTIFIPPENEQITDEDMASYLWIAKRNILINAMKKYGGIGKAMENGGLPYRMYGQPTKEILDYFLEKGKAHRQQKEEEEVKKAEQEAAKKEQARQVKAAREKRKAERAEQNKLDRQFREQQVAKNNKGA